MNALVSRLLTHSFVDGPGNRAVIFLQGCQLRCLYCHNPQTQAICSGCGLCLEHCPGAALSPGLRPGEPLQWNPDLCQGCDRCIAVCPHSADPRARPYSPTELMDWLRPFRPFLSGVTVSGGEPLLQAGFLTEFFPLVRATGLTTMIETNGLIPPTDDLLSHLDGVLIDLKVWDDAAHRDLTGADNAAIKANVTHLARAGKVAEVRMPIIPGFSDSIDHVTQTATFIAKCDPTIPVRLLRFRPHGTSGAAASWTPISDATMDLLAATARAAGLLTVTRSR